MIKDTDMIIKDTDFDESAELEIEMEEADEEHVPLEEKYSEQMRQIFPQKIELPISTLTHMIPSRIDLSPSFQRRGIWKNDRRSRFIESIIMNVPVPPVFLGEDDYGKYVVLDGRQRLTALNEYLLNNYALEKLTVWRELNDKRFNDLKQKKIENILLRRFVPAVLLLKESSTEVKYDVFDRLNTGGIIAVPMEIRNAVCRGRFNERVHELSQEKTFRKLWEIPQDADAREKKTIYRRMYDLELVLRFFALQEPDKFRTFKGTFRDYLTRFMTERNALYKQESSVPDDDRKLFHNAVENSWKVFGDDAFRRPTESAKRSKKSAPLADAVMHGLCEVDPASIDDAVRARIHQNVLALCTSDKDFQKAIEKGTNGRGAIEYRLRAAKEAVQRSL